MLNLFWIIVFIVYALILLYMFKNALKEIKGCYVENEKEDKFEQIFKETMKELQDYD